jgi:hypothetical protein
VEWNGIFIPIKKEKRYTKIKSKEVSYVAERVATVPASKFQQLCEIKTYCLPRND